MFVARGVLGSSKGTAAVVSGRARIRRFAGIAAVWGVVSFLPVGAVAVERPTPELGAPFSLSQVVALAVERNLTLEQARLEEARVRGVATVSRSALLPSLALSGSYDQSTVHADVAAIDTTTGRPVTLDARSVGDDWRLSLNGSLSLVDLPSWYRWSSARRGVESAREGTRDQIGAIVLSARQQYYALFKAGELARVARESYTLRQEQLRRAQSLFELGSVAKSDVLQAQVNLAAAERERIAAENSIAQERARLAVLLALPVDASIEIEPLSPIEDSVRVEPEAALFARAEQDLPALRGAEVQLAAARASERAARSRYLPSLGLSYTYGKTEDALSDLGSDFKRDARWGYNLGLSLPIFDGLQIFGSAQQATAQRRTREAALADARLQAALGVRESLLAIRNASEALRSAREGVRFAEESVRLQTALYESGGGTLLELNNAQVELTRARVAVVEAEANLRSAQAALDRATGVLPIQ